MKIDILKVFGERVRMERMKRGLSQEKFAELANLHRTYIGMIERGEKNITLRNIAKLADALELPLHVLLRVK